MHCCYPVRTRAVSAVADISLLTTAVVAAGRVGAVSEFTAVLRRFTAFFHVYQ